MDVLIIEPEKTPRRAAIRDELESFQQLVGGLIEAIYPYDDPVAILCNEEGKLLGLPLNRRLEDYDIIAGPFIICGLGEDRFESLSPALADKYEAKFAQPEMFIRAGDRILAIPLAPDEDLCFEDCEDCFEDCFEDCTALDVSFGEGLPAQWEEGFPTPAASASPESVAVTAPPRSQTLG